MKNSLFLAIFLVITIILLVSAGSVVQAATTITFPVGGESLERGATYPFGWTTDEIGPIQLKLRTGDTIYSLNQGQILGAGLGQALFSVPADLPLATDYLALITTPDGQVLATSARTFSVIAPPNTARAKNNQQANVLQMFDYLLKQLRSIIRG
ncbi:MAG: hypothetical protein AAB505_00650 [Patescibacteria group bacterium]